VTHDFKKSGTMLRLLAALTVAAACYAPQQPTPMRVTKYNPPQIDLAQIVGINNLDLDALRASWAMFPTGNSHARPRNYTNGTQGVASITPYRGINTIAPDKPPAKTVLFAHIVNQGPGIDKHYNLKRSKLAEYYVVVDADPMAPTTSRWRILEVPVGSNGSVTFVQRNGTDMSGHLEQCTDHTPKPEEEADFWKCNYGENHVSLFSTATALASASTMPIAREFWDNVFSAEKKSAAPVFTGDESGWASCSGGCCTLEF
jgi:hypothetical protein